MNKEIFIIVWVPSWYPNIFGVRRPRTKNQWKGLLVHTLNPRSFTLDPTTPQIFWSKMLSGMIWNVSKPNQNEQIYMFFVHFKSFYEQKWQKTCKFAHFDSIFRRSISFPITFLIEISQERLGQGKSSLNSKCVPITPFIDFRYMASVKEERRLDLEDRIWRLKFGQMQFWSFHLKNEC